MLQETARVHEAVDTQMQSMENPGPGDQVNTVDTVDTVQQSRGKGKKTKKRDKKKREEKKCYRCDGTGYLGGDKSCPALGKTCNKCGFVSHFAVCCKSKTPKRRSSVKYRTDGANQVTEEDYYAFVVKSDNDSSGVVDLCVGGVPVKNVLIDSGATFNIVDRATWETLKTKRVKCQSRICEKKLFAYGQTKPIEVVGTFKSEIYCEKSGEMCVDEFTVIEGHGKALLGKDTAETLNVLRVGPTSSPQAYSITSEGNSGYSCTL